MLVFRITSKGWHSRTVLYQRALRSSFKVDATQVRTLSILKILVLNASCFQYL